MKVSDMPGPEALNIPGRRDGQTKMIKDGNTISVHSWSEAEAQWKKVGDVVGQPKSKDSSGRGKDGGKVMYEGVEYDHVFHIDIDEGVVLKLPYNIGQDPFQVAQDFIHKHQLVIMFFCFYDCHVNKLCFSASRIPRNYRKLHCEKLRWRSPISIRRIVRSINRYSF